MFTIEINPNTAKAHIGGEYKDKFVSGACPSKPYLIAGSMFRPAAKIAMSENMIFDGSNLLI
ncbi:hypothetical protein GCM10008090_35160 [Arenicella chitinivorans]|uniref:Uncharacterized protein n=1 Tax=Arenicella chitinivorans TaxID=1329800 RepID=A0A918VT17_9GAMM|nr:hypothetical protein GCM10008090_35160 [Arenicella chitinivorans]